VREVSVKKQVDQSTTTTVVADERAVADERLTAEEERILRMRGTVRKQLGAADAISGACRRLRPRPLP
jgi:hypothetical protein